MQPAGFMTATATSVPGVKEGTAAGDLKSSNNDRQVQQLRVPLYKRRWVIITSIFVTLLVIVLLFIILFPVIRAIIQLMVKRTQIEIDRVIISNPTNES